MSQQRRIARVVTVPPLAPGFIGPGHLAAQVVSPQDFHLNDPFIMLADDHLDIGEGPVGGPHPHAGFETVTLLLEGAIYDRDEGGVINAGEVQWMTAGRGIVHGENWLLKEKCASFNYGTAESSDCLARTIHRRLPGRHHEALQ